MAGRGWCVMFGGTLSSCSKVSVKLAGMAFLMLLGLVACVPPGSIAISTPTPQPTPTEPIISTATATPVDFCTPETGVTPVPSAAIVTGNSGKRQVSLTFDSDNGSPGNASVYLSILHARGIRATWFLTGRFAQANPELVRQIRDDGHDIGNHTMDHSDLISPPRSDALICSELVNADHLIAAASGRTTRPFFRPPSGNYNDHVRALAARLGYRTVFWSIDTRDWDSAISALDIQKSIFNSPSLKPGAIILMHVNSAHETQALDGVITGLEQRGYAIVPLSQLLS